MSSPSLKAVAFRVAQPCASARPCLPPPDAHQGPAACKPAPSPVLRAHMSHTADPDAAHLRQLASVTSRRGPDPFRGGRSAGCVAFTALEQHRWQQQRALPASLQASSARQPKKKKKRKTAFSSPNCTCSPFTQMRVSAETRPSRGFPSSFIALFL